MAVLMLVDDEEDLLFIFSRILRKKGYDIISITSGEECLQKYNEMSKKPDVMIIDNKLEKMTGKELIDKLVEVNPDVKIILTSGDTTIAEEITLTKFITFLAKPFTIDVLIRRVEELLRR